MTEEELYNKVYIFYTRMYKEKVPEEEIKQFIDRLKEKFTTKKLVAVIKEIKQLKLDLINGRLN